jgi:DNA polymerase
MATDPDVVAANRMSKSIGRDYHKMTAFVRFKEIPLPEGVVGRRRFVSWFEPDHFIVDRVAPFFQRRFNDMDWLIVTPKGSASWDGETLRTSDEPAEKPDLRDDTDDLWRTYYANIFNPARLKVKMMMSEMPKKYWKNLPEAELIPGMIASAEASVIEMGRKAASEPLAFHHRIQEAAARVPMPEAPTAGTLEALLAEARNCTRCDLHCMATQTVFGEGPVNAKVMIVGEQPGDQEDLAGRPFVGPAGRVFNEAVSAAGIDRTQFYITNAVKHFKYEPRGKRRIHQKPNMGEVQQCRWWLSQELDLVQPKLVVAMGATALFSLTEMRHKLEDVRGRPIAMENGRMLFVTVHPSYLLRIPDEGRKAEEVARFREDIVAIGRLAA